jgi:hypothetical protein
MSKINFGCLWSMRRKQPENLLSKKKEMDDSSRNLYLGLPLYSISIIISIIFYIKAKLNTKILAVGVVVNILTQLAGIGGVLLSYLPSISDNINGNILFRLNNAGTIGLIFCAAMLDVRIIEIFRLIKPTKISRFFIKMVKYYIYTSSSVAIGMILIKTLLIPLKIADESQTFEFIYLTIWAITITMYDNLQAVFILNLVRKHILRDYSNPIHTKRFQEVLFMIILAVFIDWTGISIYVYTIFHINAPISPTLATTTGVIAGFHTLVLLQTLQKMIDLFELTKVEKSVSLKSTVPESTRDMSIQ